MSVGIVETITALVTAVRCAVDTRGMLCVDKTIRAFVAQFDELEDFLDDEEFESACTVFARYLLRKEVVPALMSDLADALPVVLLVARAGVPRHAAVDYECMYVAFCSDDTAQGAKRLSTFALMLAEECATLTKLRRLRRPATGRLLLVHANESNYEKVPAVAKATNMNGKSPGEGVTIEFFYAAELQFDRLTHEDVPTHVALDMLVEGARDNEALHAELHRDKKRGWELALRQREKLPILYASDIILRLLGMRQGQIVRVESRDAALGGTSFEYQQVV